MIANKNNVGVAQKLTGSFSLDLLSGQLLWDDVSSIIFSRRQEDSDLTIETWLDSIHSDDVGVVRLMLEKQIPTEKSIQLTYRVVSQNGDMRFIHTLCNVFRDDLGRPVLMEGFHLDETDPFCFHKEDSLCSFEYRNVLDASPIPYALNDDEGNITYLNQAFINTFGYDQNDIPTLAEWWPRAYPDASYRAWVEKTWRDHLEKAKETGESFESLDLTIRCKDGSDRFVIGTASALGADFTGTYQVILHDITDRKIVENELHRVHQRLKDIQFAMDQIGIGIHIVKLDGSFFYVNEAASSLLGYSQSELLNLSVAEIDPAFTKKSFKEETREFREEPGRIETMQRHRDGNLIPVEVAFQFFHGEGDEDGYFISFIYDLRERRSIESEKEKLLQQVLQAQKMESIGHLAGGIAHDFNNMLGAMLGYAELTKKLIKTPGFSIEDCDKYLNEVLTAGSRAKELVSQMLMFSRKNPPSRNGDVPIILIKPIIKEVVNLLRSSIPATITLNVNVVDEDARCQLLPVQLHQLILNLCINARDAIKEYGSIDIRLENERVNTNCDSCHKAVAGRYVVLRVSDSGSGISSTLIPRVFEPFFTTKQVGKGSGMGLSVVHGIVHSAGGHISLQSNDRSGTCVSVFLPIVDRVSNREISLDKSSHEENAKAILSGIRIMVVDDEPSISSMLEVLLKTHGATVKAFN
ncbi:MAG: PAS domain S-box protein, partial [Gammaproteobacteria bacterium]|nr:PAS domain S-box protein [Gammaproteobacteria bacterium]